MRRGGILASVHNAGTNEFLVASFSLLRVQKFWPGNLVNDEFRVLFETSNGLWEAIDYLGPSGNSGPEYTSICAVVVANDVRHARCPVGAFVGPNDKCYLVGTDGQSWSHAEKQCNKQGGTLVSIYDWHTNLAVLHILRVHSSQWYWIGAPNRTGKWSWSNGGAFNFSNWRHGEFVISPKII